MLQFIGSFLVFFIMFSGCSGEKCCVDLQSESQLDPTSYSLDIPVTDTSVPPEAIITYTHSSCKTGETISFNGHTSYSTDTNDQIVSYEWIQEGNVIDTDSNITLKCDIEGQKEICLQVTDNNNLINKKCQTYNVTNNTTTIPPVAIIAIDKRTEHGFWFDCSQSYDQDQIDSDNNSSNDTQVVKATWNIYKTKNGERQPLHTRDICRKWVGVSDDLDFMEVTLVVTDDDNETASVTEIYTWDGQELIKEP